MLRPEVPPQLDDAVRLCLEREPGNRYRSALELGQALEAGLHGEATDATRRLALTDTDATRALAATEITSSTRAMPRTSYAPPLERPAPALGDDGATGAPRDPRRAAVAEMASFFALLLVLAAVGAVAIALLASNEGDTPVEAPNADEVQQQIDDLRDFIGDNGP